MTDKADHAAAREECKSWLDERNAASPELVNVACAYLEHEAELQAAREPLEPCPFCGSATVMHIVGEGISCRACHAQVLGAGVTGDVETWNRRAMRPAPAEAQGSVEELADLLASGAEADDDVMARAIIAAGWRKEAGRG